jgi:hypothetical protein
MRAVIKDLLDVCVKRKKSLNVLRRFLSIHYKINISINALTKRLNYEKTKTTRTL